jgi:hypothetical protein
MATKTIGRAEIGFSITGISGDIAYDVQVDFYPVAKLPIDLKAAGGIGAGFHQYGSDLGEPIISPPTPVPPKDLPPGITEVYQS